MTQVRHWAKTAQTNHVTLRPWPLTLEVVAPVADAGRRRPSLHQVWSSSTLPFGRYVTRCMWALMGQVTLTFDVLTFKLMCESRQRWETFLPNVGTLGLWVLELFAMYATDGRTDGRADKNNAYCPFPTGGGIIKCVHTVVVWFSVRALSPTPVICKRTVCITTVCFKSVIPCICGSDTLCFFLVMPRLHCHCPSAFQTTPHRPVCCSSGAGSVRTVDFFLA